MQKGMCTIAFRYISENYGEVYHKIKYMEADEENILKSFFCNDDS